MSRRLSASACAGLIVLSMSAAAALAYTGTSAGKKLAGQMLASYKNVHYLAGSVHGSVYYCPSQIGGYFEAAGSRAPASCRNNSATVSWVNTLSKGNGASAVGTVVSKGKPTITFVASRGATFTQAKGARCWTRQSVDYTFVGYAPFGFFPNEYMTVGAKHKNTVDLMGTMPGGHFKETDTIGTKSHQIVSEDIWFNLKSSTPAEHLLTTYHQVSQAPKVPGTSPVC